MVFLLATVFNLTNQYIKLLQIEIEDVIEQSWAHHKNAQLIICSLLKDLGVIPHYNIARHMVPPRIEDIADPLWGLLGGIISKEEKDDHSNTHKRNSNEVCESYFCSILS
ncbi:MAG: hypothetical protein LBF56_03345 [Holosporales bacterium]|jgi:hypothetical protein|nr:hypothetical protein [Holosporales bacterium]